MDNNAPQTLELNEIDVKIEIPSQLQKPEFRFILVEHKRKKPKELEWQKTNNYGYDNPKILEHISKGGNYGVLCGRGSLAVIDADHPDVVKSVESYLPKTFMVKTGNGGAHFYYICKDLNSTIKLKDNGDRKTEHFGEVQFTGAQVVGPGSIHPNNNPYIVINGIEVQNVSSTQIRFALRDFIKTDAERTLQKENEQANRFRYNLDSLSIKNVVRTIDLKQRGNEYQGSHPVHGSKTGTNFCVSIIKNLWHCFRHSSGGGPLSLIAVLEGIIECEDARPSSLRDELFKKVVMVAKDKYGFNVKTTKQRFKSKKDQEDKVDPSVIGNELMQDFTFKTSIDNEEVYIYNDGIYHDTGQQFIKQESKKRYPILTKHEVNEVIFHVQAKSYISRQSFNSNTKYIHLENGIFNIDEMILQEFTPDIISTVKIPIRYDPNATCPNNIHFLTETISKVYIPTIEEMYGYFLYPNCFAQKAFFFIGGGANGKTTFNDVIVSLLGEQNCLGLSLQELCNRPFAKAQLFGKLVNIDFDLTQIALTNTGVFKAAVSGDLMTADVKFKVHPITFRNRAKLIFAANQMPETRDKSAAFYRRMIMIRFLNKFEGASADKHLINRLTTTEELSGLFNLAVKGLRRLLTNGGEFTYDKTTEEIEELYEIQSNSVVAFLNEMCVDVANSRIPCDELYQLFSKFCIKHKLDPQSKRAFNQKMRSLGYIDRKLGGRGDRKTFWEGLQLKWLKNNNTGTYY